MNKLLLTSAIVIFAGAAYAAPVKTVSTGLGDVLAGDNGMTLYTFKKDTAGVSNCYDQCATNWPPLVAADGDAAEDGGHGADVDSRAVGFEDEVLPGGVDSVHDRQPRPRRPPASRGA